jgi:membrane protein YqaA with SNARE-associated domain
MSEIAKTSGLRALYAWALKAAGSRHAWRVLAGVAFAEAFFLPIPPDVILLPMMLADRKRAFQLGLWCAFWSAIGGLIGYAIGALFWTTAGLWLVGVFHISLAEVENVRQQYAQHSYWIVAQAGLPIPYTIVTIASGLAGVPVPLFMGYSVLARALRFVFLEGALIYFFGEKAKELLDKYLETAMVIFLVAILALVAFKYRSVLL